MTATFIENSQSPSGAFMRQGGVNRRRFMRVHPSVLASRVAARDVRQVGILVENISLGGAFLRTDRPLPLGETLDLELARPGHGNLVKVSGRVVSTVQQERAVAEAKAPGMGVSFQPLDDVTRSSLKALIRSFVPEGTALELPLAQPVLLTATRPEPVSELSQDSAPVPVPRPSAPRRDDSQKLALQLRGLVMQVGQLQEEISKRDNEIDGLHTAVERLQLENAALRRRIAGYERS